MHWIVLLGLKVLVPMVAYPEARAFRAVSFSVVTTPAAKNSLLKYAVFIVVQEESETVKVSKMEFDCLTEMTGLQIQMSSMNHELSDEREASKRVTGKDWTKAQP